MRILILCTGNSCRSQMAAAFLRSFDASMKVCSAGTQPADSVHPFAVRVMAELGIDISRELPKNVEIYKHQSWDYVITVCMGASETCPVFVGRVTHRLHFEFDDPATVRGDEDFVLSEFRRIRDEIKDTFFSFYQHIIKR
jgi:arsenate reductase